MLLLQCSVTQRLNGTASWQVRFHSGSASALVGRRVGLVGELTLVAACGKAPRTRLPLRGAVAGQDGRRAQETRVQVCLASQNDQVLTLSFLSVFLRARLRLKDYSQL